MRGSLAGYRSLFCRSAGFEHVSRYVTGLLVSPNKTLQGIHALQVGPQGQRLSSRAMHAAVFEAGWQSEELMPRHRQVVSGFYQGQRRAVISLDWTLNHHARGPQIYGVKHGYDYVQQRYGRFQTVLTATVSNAQRLDGIAVEIQLPEALKAEKAYLMATVKTDYATLGEARQRVLEVLHYQLHHKRYRKITELALAVVKRVEQEPHCPQSGYAFDNGVLNLDLSRFIESCGKHWVSEGECSRHSLWQGRWRRVDEVAAELKQTYPHSFRRLTFPTRTGEEKMHWAFSKAVRLKRYGKKRLRMVHEEADLSDTPRFLLTDAVHWEGGRILTTWSYRWSSELFHEFSKQHTGFESAQLRTEEAVKRHLRLSCVAQTILQTLTGPASTSERFTFAQGQMTQGQRTRTVARQLLHSVLAWVQRAFKAGKTQTEILDLLMPT